MQRREHVRKREELERELENKKSIISMQGEWIMKLNTQLCQERTLRKQAEYKLSRTESELQIENDELSIMIETINRDRLDNYHKSLKKREMES